MPTAVMGVHLHVVKVRKCSQTPFAFALLDPQDRLRGTFLEFNVGLRPVCPDMLLVLALVSTNYNSWSLLKQYKLFLCNHR